MINLQETLKLGTKILKDKVTVTATTKILIAKCFAFGWLSS